MTTLIASKNNFDMNYRPFKKTPKLEYINEGIVNSRLKGLYKSILNNDYDRTKFLVEDTINMIKTTTEIDIDKELYNKIIDELYQMIMELIFKKYNSVHDRIRDLHYLIIQSYLQ
jgi:hypothetical protein